MSADSASTSSADSTSPVHHFKTFEAIHDQVREARRFLVGLLDGCPAADEAILVLSELATNCVVHSASSEPGGKFTITAEICHGDYVRIEARDQGGPWNQRPSRDGRAHGLDIIAKLAASHGVSGDPSTGWTAWAILPWHPSSPNPPANT